MEDETPEQKPTVEPLVVTDKSLNDLIGDPLFKIMEFMDVKSIQRLCRASLQFQAFCRRHEGNIYRYLLARDFGLPASAYDSNNAKSIYKQRHKKEIWGEMVRREGSVKFILFTEIGRAAAARRQLATIYPNKLAKYTGRVAESYTLDNLRHSIWTIRTNICLKIVIVDLPGRDDIYITDEKTLVGVHRGAYVESLMEVYESTPVRVIEKCYDRLYPEVLPFIWHKEISAIFREVIYPETYGVKGRNNHTPSGGPYKTLLSLFPVNHPTLITGIQRAIATSLSLLRTSILVGRSDEEITVVSLGEIDEHTYPVETRFCDAYNPFSKTTAILILYFALKIFGLLEEEGQ